MSLKDFKLYLVPNITTEETEEEISKIIEILTEKNQ